MYLDKYIKQLRKENNLTQQQLADAIGVSRTTIRNMETGTTSFPRKDVLKAISKFKDIPELEVANCIIFPKDSIEDLVSQPTSELFISYMYMNGWNVEYNPMMFNMKEKEYFFPGLISKKREKNNSYLVADFCEYELRFEEEREISSKYMEGFLLDMISVVIKCREKFRGLYVVFNDCYEEPGRHQKAFEAFSQLRANKIALDIKAVLFNLETKAITDERKLKK